MAHMVYYEMQGSREVRYTLSSRRLQECRKPSRWILGNEVLTNGSRTSDERIVDAKIPLESPGVIATRHLTNLVEPTSNAEEKSHFAPCKASRGTTGQPHSRSDLVGLASDI
jgi:hypothetical protein